MRETTKGALFVIAAMGMFAFMGIFVRFLNLPVLTIVFFLFAFSALALFAYFLLFRRDLLSLPGAFFPLILLSAVNLFNNLLYFQSFLYTSIGNAVLTHYTAPLFVALLAPFVLKEKIERIAIIALILSFAGIFIITFPGFSLSSHDTIGILYGAASGLMYALVILTIKHLSKSVSPYTIVFYMSLGVSVFLFPFVARNFSVLEPGSISLLVLFALLFGVGATILHVQGVKRLPSHKAGILAYTEPFLAPIYAFMFLHEVPTPWTIIGGGFILLGGFLIIRRNA